MEPQWERLGQTVLTRRTSRGWSQTVVSERGGPSDTLQSKIESGQWRPTRGVDETLRKIDTGLEWAAGSASQVLAGGSATPSESLHTQAPTPAVADPVTMMSVVQLVGYIHNVVDLLTGLDGERLSPENADHAAHVRAATGSLLIGLTAGAEPAAAALILNDVTSLLQMVFADQPRTAADATQAVRHIRNLRVHNVEDSNYPAPKAARDEDFPKQDEPE